MEEEKKSLNILKSQFYVLMKYKKKVANCTFDFKMDTFSETEM